MERRDLADDGGDRSFELGFVLFLSLSLRGGFLALDQVVKDVRIAGGGEGGLVPHGQDDAAELGAPVADMVLADDAVAEKFQYSAGGVADDGAAEMADVHFLRDVGAG